MSLAARGVSFAFRPDRPVLRGVSVEVRPGRVTAIIGPNGAGKSTLVRILLGVLGPRPAGGEPPGSCVLDDRPVASIAARDRARRLAFIPQSPEVHLEFSAREVVALGRFALDAGASRADRAGRALAEVGLEPVADRAFGRLSAGQRQRVVLARAIAQLDPPPPGAAPGEGKYLLADEPFSALDPRHARDAVRLLRALAARGVGLAVVLHDLACVRDVADDVLILDGSGRSRHASELGPGDLEQVFDTPFLRWRSERGDEVVQAAPGREDRYHLPR